MAVATIKTTIVSTIDLDTYEQAHTASIDAMGSEAEELEQVILLAVAKSACVATIGAVHERVPELNDEAGPES